MRIVSGKYRGKKLNSPKNENVRPTADRVKENVFNILQNRIYGCRFLDLFAGSGAMGIEAISRGAEFVRFCDVSKESVALLKQNLTGIEGDYQICHCDYKMALEGEFDVIYIDPPYHCEWIDDILQHCAAALRDNGILLFEHLREKPLKNIAKPFIIKDERNYGTVSVLVLSKESI